MDAYSSESAIAEYCQFSGHLSDRIQIVVKIDDDLANRVDELSRQYEHTDTVPTIEEVKAITKHYIVVQEDR